MRILVTGAGSVLGQAIIKSIKLSSLNAEIIAVDPSNLAVGLYWSDRHYLVPMANQSNYMSEIYNIIDKETPDAILIGTDVELEIFSKYKNEIEQRYKTKVLVSSTEVINIADDKWLTYEFLRNNGFDYPESCLPGDEDELIAAVGFPLIVKPRVGARSVGVSKVNNHVELQESIKKVENPIIQECVGTEDNEYTAGVIVYDQKARASIVMRRDLKDGNTFRAYSLPFSEINTYIERVAEKLNPYGSVNFQFRIEGAKIKIFEINGRFSGTTHFRALSNYNEVEMCLKFILFNEEITQPLIKPVTILRYYEEMVMPLPDSYGQSGEIDG